MNDGMSEALSDLDGAEKASRMQAFMMSNPQEAMKILQATQSAGNAYNETGGQREEARSTRLGRSRNTTRSPRRRTNHTKKFVVTGGPLPARSQEFL